MQHLLQHSHLQVGVISYILSSSYSKSLIKRLQVLYGGLEGAVVNLWTVHEPRLGPESGHQMVHGLRVYGLQVPDAATRPAPQAATGEHPELAAVREKHCI